MDLGFLSILIPILLIGAFSPFTFRVIIESYEFRAIVLSVDFMFVVRFSSPL